MSIYDTNYPNPDKVHHAKPIQHANNIRYYLAKKKIDVRHLLLLFSPPQNPPFV